MSHVENLSAQTVTTTAETAVGSTGLQYTQASAQQVNQGMPAKIVGIVNITAGTATTAITVRCRAGTNTTTGTVVQQLQLDSLAAGNSESIPFEFVDPNGSVNGYTITVQQTAATGNGTVNYVSFDVTANG